jgi:hypothetical protein
MGFLVLSFHPTGPKERTPTGSLGEPISALDRRVALAVGYSVTGGSEDTEFLLIGASYRASRYFALTGGVAVPESGDGPSFGFIGFAGDLTAFPFLNDLFVTSN